jgi:hypothetical protein
MATKALRHQEIAAQTIGQAQPRRTAYRTLNTFILLQSLIITRQFLPIVAHQSRRLKIDDQRLKKDEVKP